jgi:hypothetical protein
VSIVLGSTINLEVLEELELELVVVGVNVDPVTVPLPPPPPRTVEMIPPMRPLLEEL